MDETLFKLINELSVSVGRIEGRLGGIEDKLESVHQQTLKTNGRVTIQEGRWQKTKGMAVATGAIAGGIITVFWKIFDYIQK